METQQCRTVLPRGFMVSIVPRPESRACYCCLGKDLKKKSLCTNYKNTNSASMNAMLISYMPIHVGAEWGALCNWEARGGGAV